MGLFADTSNGLCHYTAGHYFYGTCLYGHSAQWPFCYRRPLFNFCFCYLHGFLVEMGGGEDESKSQIVQIGQMSQINSDHTKFLIKARFKSLGYAFTGLKSFFNSQHNAWIHLLATVVVIFLVIVLQVSYAEAIALAGAVGLVWVSELFNTAIEKIMNFISTETNPEIKLIKDISAAAVLVAAITALAVGCFVFIPKF